MNVFSGRHYIGNLNIIYLHYLRELLSINLLPIVDNLGENE